MHTNLEDKKLSPQEKKVLDALMKAKGNWVDGEVFLRRLYLSQYHARIHGLQRKGFPIKASEFTNEHGFKSYRLEVGHPLKQAQLF